MCNEKIVFDDDAKRVEYRDGTQYCVFMTQSGQEVLYFRDKNDVIVKNFAGSLEALEDIRCRGIAAKLLEKRILDRGPQYTRKKVCPPSSVQTVRPKTAPAVTGWRPSKMDEWCAGRHAQQIDPHIDDD